MTIAREMLEFSKSRPAWQQDLIRRICTQQALQKSDIETALNNLKASHGLASAQELSPLREEHLSRRETAPRVSVALGAISDVRNANQLAPNQRLPFAVDGITLIYGHNGSGKTGYARIIKQLCRARCDKPEPLLGNVYKSSGRPAEAEVSFLTDGKVTTVRWKDGDPAPPLLSQISVFDASCAPLYADHQNEIEFLPWGLDVLPTLGRACQTLAQYLQSEIDVCAKALSVPLPQQIADSSAGTLVRQLTPDTPAAHRPTDEAIRRAASWSDRDAKELEEVEKELQRLSEPAKAAAQCRRLKVGLEALNSRLTSVSRLLSSEAITTYRDQLLKTQAAQEAASIASKARFDQDPLGATIGTLAWRKLYEAAEEFNSLAYPGEAFPAVGADKVCLLCEQPFGEAATDRMIRFRQFMQDTTQKEAQAQRTRLDEIVGALETARIPTTTDMELLLAEHSATEPSFGSVKSELAQFISRSSALLPALAESLKGGTPFEATAALDSKAIDSAKEFANALERKAKTFDESAADIVATTELKKRHTELLGRQQLNLSLATVVSRHHELEKYDRLLKCKGQCDTYQISRKNSEFRDKYLTADFERELKEQVRLLGLDYLPIKLDAKTEKGASFVGVGLNTVTNARNANVLSEGEFRALALACFFAEIATIPNHNGIVIDDPVSSLDHRHMKQVARRLVDEAKARSQVIVFTHDLSFYYELWSAAAEAQVPILRHWVQHRPPDSFGIVDADDGPWEVKKTKDRIGALNALLMGIPEEPQSLEDHAQQVRNFYTRLRETWERLVEECLLRNVVGRFQPGVQTQSLKGVNVTDEDYKLVFFNMKKVSEYSGHDWATGREGKPPSKEDMAKDLAILKSYREELTERAKKLEGQRRELEHPPKAQTIAPPAPTN